MDICGYFYGYSQISSREKKEAGEDFDAEIVSFEISGSIQLSRRCALQFGGAIFNGFYFPACGSGAQFYGLRVDSRLDPAIPSASTNGNHFKDLWQA